MNYLNLLLSILQFVIAFLVSPLLYSLQGFGGNRTTSSTIWTAYPSTEYQMNYVDALKCLLNLLNSDDQSHKYPDTCDCINVFPLVVGHVIAIVVVGIAVNKIVDAGATKVMYRGISAGIIVAVCVMRYYDLLVPDFDYGPLVSLVTWMSLVILILGTEVYHRDNLQESTFETIYPPPPIPTTEETGTTDDETDQIENFL